MSNPLTAPIPVFLSRFTPGIHDKPGYGAFIHWNIGERVKCIPTVEGNPPFHATVRSELLWDDRAPEVDSARGVGRWVIQVLCEDTNELAGVSAARVFFA